MATKNKDVLGYRHCPDCEERGTVHQAAGTRCSLYQRCGCGCDQRNGKRQQSRFWYETEWLPGLKPDTSPTKDDKPNIYSEAEWQDYVAKLAGEAVETLGQEADTDTGIEADQDTGSRPDSDQGQADQGDQDQEEKENGQQAVETLGQEADTDTGIEADQDTDDRPEDGRAAARDNDQEKPRKRKWPWVLLAIGAGIAAMIR